MKAKNTFQIFKNNLEMIRRLLKYSKGHRPSYSIAMLINAFTCIRYNFVIGLSIQWVTDSAIAKDWPRLKSALIFSLIAYTGNFILSFFEGYLMESRVSSITGELKNALFGRFVRLPMRFHDNHHSGDLQSRLTSDLSTASEAISFTLVNPINALSVGLISLVLIGFIRWEIALICTVFVILSLLLNAIFMKPMENAGAKIQESISAATKHYSDIINGLPVIKLFNLQHWAKQRYNEENGKILAWQFQINQLNSLQNSCGALMNHLLKLGVIGIGALFLASGKISAGSLLAIARYTFFLSFAFSWFGWELTHITQLLAGAKRVFEIMDNPIEVNAPLAADHRDQIKPDLPKSPALSFQKVSFQYHQGNQIIENLSLDISQGEVTALVGLSGVGKTTLMKLIMGFYDFQGAMYLFGKNINEYSLAERRQLLTYVPQSTYSFSGTIRENIALGNIEASDSEIIEAARAANIHDFVISLPHGYHTEIGERGCFLSGGERQRISIARALLKNAPILLLDEPTASLDSHTEQEVQKALEVLLQGRTVIVAAHRLSTIQHADKIIVMEKGKVSESGNHEELMKLNQRYAYYYNLLYN